MVAIYARQSIEKKDSVSIETQIEKCKYYCNNNKYKIYKDAGYSGKNINRPQFTQLLNDIRSGIIKKVIAYRLDRISRSIADFSQLLLLFDEYNVDFISATENFDTNTPMGRAMINIVMTFAQLERETIVERVTDNYYFRANNGDWMGGYTPYGYKYERVIGNDGKKHSILFLDEKEAPVVKRIFDMYINQNMSMRRIAQALAIEKIPTKKKYGTWGINAVKAILTRPIYTPGTTKIYNYYNQKGTKITNPIETFDGTKNACLYGKSKKITKVKAIRDYKDMFLSLFKCEPLISNEDWFKAQILADQTKKLPPRTNTSRISYLCGLVKCGKCQTNMVTQYGGKNMQGKKYYYLICTKKKNLGIDYCNNKMIEIRKLEQIVLDDIKKHFKSDAINKRIEKYLKAQKNNSNDLIKQKEDFENESLKIDIQIENLINSIADGNATISKYINQKIEELEKQKNEILENLSKLDISDNSFQDIELINYVKNIEEKLNTNSFEDLKILCHTIIDKIIITDENIDIHYKI